MSVGFAPLGTIPLASWWFSGTPQTSNVAISINVVTNPCDWYATTVSATSWAEQSTPATTWTEQDNCG
jgi:hypothetical protein